MSSGLKPGERVRLNGELRAHKRARRARRRAPAEHGLALEWLRTVPGYRELIRQRVARAAREAERRALLIDNYHADRDYLGRDLEGCG